MTTPIATHNSYWRQRTAEDYSFLAQRYPTLEGNVRTNVLVIGAGITGLSAALELLDRGFDVTICESSVIGAGTTGGSSGHLDAHPEMGPRKLLKKLGEADAKRFVQLRLDAIGAIESRCDDTCQFARIPGYYYSESKNDRDDILAERDAAAKIGLSVSWMDSIPLHFGAMGYRVDGMGRVDSLAYQQRLAQLVTAAGGKIFEQSLVSGPVEPHPKSLQVKTQDKGTHTVSFDHVVCAVHCNYTDAFRIYFQTPAYQSYVAAIRVSNPPPDALYWDNSHPYFYARRLSNEDGQLILVGGCDHRTGDGDPLRAQENLDDYIRSHYDVKEFVCRWSAELFEPTDGLPIIGKVPGKENVWVATGLSGVGLTLGTAAGWLIADEICGRANPLDAISPSRLGIGGLAKMASEQAVVAEDYAERILPTKSIDPTTLHPGEGDVGTVNGEHVAVCRDHRGFEHRMSPICTHMGGVLRWNETEQTWDCPVHGGRFATDGKRLYGPPEKDLETLNAPATQRPDSSDIH